MTIPLPVFIIICVPAMLALTYLLMWISVSRVVAFSNVCSHIADARADAQTGAIADGAIADGVSLAAHDSVDKSSAILFHKVDASIYNETLSEDEMLCEDTLTGAIADGAIADGAIADGVSPDEDETLDETLNEMLSEMENPSPDQIQDALDSVFEARLIQGGYMASSTTSNAICANPSSTQSNTICDSASSVFISGRHKGKALSEVPRKYIQWLKNHGY